MRKHGWQLPYHPLQVVAICVFLALGFGFYVFLLPFVGKKQLQYVFLGLYTPLVTCVFSLYIWCAATDPSDPGVFKSKSQHGAHGQSSQQMSQDGMFYCSLCEVEVLNKSKHCRVCDKCTDGFDHHCRWLNNCIGRRNYRRFFVLMISALLLLILQWSVGILVMLRCFLDRKHFSLEIASKLGSSFSFAPFVVVEVICTGLAMFATLPVSQLFFFHVLLIKKGISTYDFIIAMREQEQQGVDGHQSPQMSSVSSLTGLSIASSFGAFHHAAWCTPPRSALEDQVDVVNPEASMSIMGKRSVTEASSKKKNVHTNPWTLARLNTEEVFRAAAQARKKSRILQPIRRQEMPLEQGRDTILAPLQLEARSAFQTIRAMSSSGVVIASSPDSSLGSPDHPFRSSSSGAEEGSLQTLTSASKHNAHSFPRSNSDGYEASGGEDSDRVPSRIVHRSSDWSNLFINTGHGGVMSKLKATSSPRGWQADM